MALEGLRQPTTRATMKMMESWSLLKRHEYPVILVRERRMLMALVACLHLRCSTGVGLGHREAIRYLPLQKYLLR